MIEFLRGRVVESSVRALGVVVVLVVFSQNLGLQDTSKDGPVCQFARDLAVE